ncbi:MAG: sulfate ABC transporter substrate-binding protein [Paenibacillus dendritiformis]|uniref:sulfate ABC transporter substrate-binding protein n=1 Tax=uncultured Paenibacillus sp. TaxID=227322 RepID=UPI0025F6193D|nr:sulfate ABC transporter substrate-binding protein [uncultured Paenibacillus sp.]MDU5141986.1 sulfate ABC transporter substrate-binding protein [Paenibacillus dendritiformis]
MDRDQSRGLSGFIATVIIFILLFGCSPGVRDASLQEGRQDQTTTAVSAPQPTPSAKAFVPSSPEASGQDSVTLVIGAYSVVRDVMQRILPEFAADWKAKTGQQVVFQESYEASGTQARSIAGGLEADVALFSMEGDVDKLVQAGLVPADWQARDAYGGMVTGSIVVLGTRQGNPHRIRDWNDLTKPGVQVLYPNPKTSGGAQWDINAIYGAGLLEAEERGEDGPRRAKELLMSVHRNVISMDKSGRASMSAFEYGVGDVIVTYENEILSRMQAGVPYELVRPERTIRIDNPVVVVERYAEKHGTTDLAQAFVDYLREPKAQRLLAEAGFRPVAPTVRSETADRYPEPAGLFGIEDMGGWKHVRETLYSKRGIWYEVLAGIKE